MLTASPSLWVEQSLYPVPHAKCRTLGASSFVLEDLELVSVERFVDSFAMFRPVIGNGRILRYLAISRDILRMLRLVGAMF